MMNAIKESNTSTIATSHVSTNATAYNVTAQAGVNITRAYTTEGDSFLLVSHLLIGVIGVLGNSLVIVVIGSSRKMRMKLFNFFLLNQSAIDLAASVMLIINGGLHYGIKLKAEDFRGLAAQVYCKIISTDGILWGLLASSTYNLLALTVERYLEIVKPIWHKIHYTRKVAKVKLAACLVLGQVYGIGLLAGTSGMVDGQCVLYSIFPNEHVAHLAFFLILIIDYILPVAVIVGCYTGIVVALRSRVDAKREANSSSDMMTRARRNTLRTLVVVAVCFVVCWTYADIVYFLDRFAILPVTFLQSRWLQLASVIPTINSCINPFIHSLQYKEFQKAAKKLFGCKHQNNSIGDSTIQTAFTD